MPGPGNVDVTSAAAVSVSAANYRVLERDDLLQRVDWKNSVNPEAQPLMPLKEPKRFVFLQGDTFESDLSYREVCAILTPPSRQRVSLSLRTRRTV